MAYRDRSAGAGRAGLARPRRSGAGGRFFLYVEGPRDCDILRSWARRLSRPLAHAIDQSTVILGGRQPARALEHFGRASAEAPGVRGLCVLDRDDGRDVAPQVAALPAGFEFFTWPRRHIESYLLVPAAIARHARGALDESRIASLIALVPDAADPQRADAKRFLARRGPLSLEAGRPLSAAGVARVMRAEEIHADVVHLFERVGEGAGLTPDVVVVKRSARGRRSP